MIAASSAASSAAVELSFPATAQITASLREPVGSYSVPTGRHDGTALPVRRVEGMVERIAYRIAAPGLSTLNLLMPLRAQLAAAGFRMTFECETESCGGFDFRYGADLLPEPEMHVDLGDFRHLSAERGDEVVTLMVSRSAMAGFVQMTRIAPAASAAFVAPQPGARPDIPTAPVAGPAVAVALSASNTRSDATVRAGLEATGRAVLEDLVFASGTTALAEGDYPSLAELAGWLREDGARKVALVGHTDASGGLETNITISRRRAEAVRAVLVGRHGVAPAQVAAEGVGYLSPRASNATEDGRHANRRVEAVLTEVP